MVIFPAPRVTAVDRFALDAHAGHPLARLIDALHADRPRR